MVTPAQEYEVTLFDCKQYQELFQLIEQNRHRLLDYFAGTCKSTSSLHLTKDYCVEINAKIQQKSYFPFIIKKSSSTEFIGFIDVKNIDWPTATAEIGYFVNQKQEGNGLMEYGVTEVLNWLRTHTDLNIVFCRVHEQNLKSCNLAHRVGFSFDCLLKANYAKSDGEVVDLKKYTLKLR